MSNEAPSDGSSAAPAAEAVAPAAAEALQCLVSCCSCRARVPIEDTLVVARAVGKGGDHSRCKKCHAARSRIERMLRNPRLKDSVQDPSNGTLQGARGPD